MDIVSKELTMLKKVLIIAKTIGLFILYLPPLVLMVEIGKHQRRKNKLNMK
jgi:hypothetical protein